MASLITQYKKMKLVDKLLIPGSLAIILWIAAHFSTLANPWVAVSVFLGFYGFAHLLVTKAMATAVLIVFVLQIIAFLPSAFLYATTASNHVDDSAALSLGSLYMLAATYLAAWSTRQWNNGLWWPRLLLAFASIDIIAPLLAGAFNVTNFYIVAGIGLALVALVSLPWARWRTNAVKDIPQDVKSEQASSAVESLVASMDGVKVSQSTAPGVDFVALKGKKKFHVCVLGKGRNLRISGDSIQYGPDNIKGLLFHLGTLGKSRHSIPVVVNYSDQSMSFVEVNASLKSEKRRGMPVILTTPPKLVEIIRES